LFIFGFFVISYPCQAATSFAVEEIILNASGGESKEFKQSLIVDSYSNLEWLELDSALKLYLDANESSYRYLKLNLRLPEYLPLLKLNTDYQWNEKYEVFEYGFDFNWKPFKGFKLNLGVNSGAKDVFPGENDRYINHWDEERLNLSYNNSGWFYKFKLTHLEKKYPHASYYSSEKFNLRQEIYSDVNSKLRLGIIYQEWTADYPWDTSLTRDYWKEEWELTGRYRQAKDFYWKWSCYSKAWDQGFDPYLDSRGYSLEANWWQRKVYNIALKYSYAELDYYSAAKIYSDEEEEYLEEDLKSRTEQRLGLNFRRFVGDFEFGSKVDLLDKDYCSESVADTLTWGLTTSCKWQRDNFKTQLTLGPFNNNDTNSTYQLKLSYNFK